MSERIQKRKQPSAAIHLPLPPAFIKPQLLVAAEKIPEGKDWIHEIKYDGWRIIARLVDGKTKLLTRNENDYSTAKNFREVAKEIADHVAVSNAVLDGEMVSQEGKLHYYVFDILYLNGKDLRPLPLIERKKELRKILENAPTHIHFVEHFGPEVIEDVDLLQHARKIGVEGIVSKRIDSPYRSGRRNETWLKIKCAPR